MSTGAGETPSKQFAAAFLAEPENRADLLLTAEKKSKLENSILQLVERLNKNSNGDHVVNPPPITVQWVETKLDNGQARIMLKMAIESNNPYPAFHKAMRNIALQMEALNADGKYFNIKHTQFSAAEIGSGLYQKMTEKEDETALSLLYSNKEQVPVEANGLDKELQVTFRSAGSVRKLIKALNQNLPFNEHITQPAHMGKA